MVGLHGCSGFRPAGISLDCLSSLTRRIGHTTPGKGGKEGKNSHSTAATWVQIHSLIASALSAILRLLPPLHNPCSIRSVRLCAWCKMMPNCLFMPCSQSTCAHHSTFPMDPNTPFFLISLKRVPIDSARAQESFGVLKFVR